MRRNPFILSENDSTHIVLRERQSADALCQALNDTPDGYVLAHGQYAPSSYAVVESPLAPSTHLRAAMQALELQHDFNLDGTRRTITPV